MPPSAGPASDDRDHDDGDRQDHPAAAFDCYRRGDKAGDVDADATANDGVDLVGSGSGSGSGSASAMIGERDEAATERAFARHCGAFYSASVSSSSSSSSSSERSFSSSSSSSRDIPDAGRDGGTAAAAAAVVEALSIACRHADRRVASAPASAPAASPCFASGAVTPSHVDGTKGNGDSDVDDEFLDEYVRFLRRCRSDDGAAAPTTTASDAGPNVSATLAALSECGLSDPRCVLQTLVRDPNRLGRYVRARDAARAGAHARGMLDRYEALGDALVREFGASRGECGGGGDNDNGGRRCGRVSVTSRSELRRIRSVVRHFVSSDKGGGTTLSSRWSTKSSPSIGMHPLLAGWRRALELQLASSDVTVRWSLDGAAITEGCRAGEGAGGKGAKGAAGDGAVAADWKYIGEAAKALGTCLVWMNDDDVGSNCDGVGKKVKEEKEGCVASFCSHDRTATATAATKTSMITFVVDPQLSDHSIRKILEVLPPFRDLHARPTGTATTEWSEYDTTALRFRTNADGADDDVGGGADSWCAETMENVCFGWRKMAIFCGGKGRR